MLAFGLARMLRGGSSVIPTLDQVAHAGASTSLGLTALEFLTLAGDSFSSNEIQFIGGSSIADNGAGTLTLQSNFGNDLIIISQGMLSLQAASNIVIEGNQTIVFLGGSSLQDDGSGSLSITGTGLVLSANSSVLNICQTTDELAFFGAAGVSKRTVTGSRASGAALVSLLNALASYGLIINSTST